VKNNILLLLFFSFIVSVNAQEINNLSDFFRNKKGEIKISKGKQAKLKTVLGSNFNCILECCLNNNECSTNNSFLDINSKLEQIEKDYNNRFQNIQILKLRNSDTLSKMNLNLDTINYFSKFADIKLKLKRVQEINFEKSKISSYLDPKLYEQSDLKKYLTLLNDLAKEQEFILNYEGKLKQQLENWEKLLEPIEKERIARVQEEWKQFVKGQMLIRWDIEKERLEKERLKKKQEEEEKKKEQEQRELEAEQEEQKFDEWEENLKFSIKYKHKIIEGIYRCVKCEEEGFACHADEFPKLDFSNYAYPDHMEKLWKKHKNNESTVQTNIFGIPDDCFLIKFGSIVSPGSENKYCEYCGRKLKLYEKNETVNKIFKN